MLGLGSGGGIDVLLSARPLGSTGEAYGVDMAGAANVEFLEATIESIPLSGNIVGV